MSTEKDDEYENVPDFAPNKQAENSQQSSQGSDSSQSQNSPPKKSLYFRCHVFCIWDITNAFILISKMDKNHFF